MSRFPHKNRAAVGGSLENFIIDRNFQSRSKSRIFLIFGPSGTRKSKVLQQSTPNMTGRPGFRTMEMIGGTSVSYLARTPCVPLFLLCLIGVETEGLLDYWGRAGIISIVRWNLRPVIFGVEVSFPERQKLTIWFNEAPTH